MHIYTSVDVNKVNVFSTPIICDKKKTHQLSIVSCFLYITCAINNIKEIQDQKKHKRKFYFVIKKELVYSYKNKRIGLIWTPSYFVVFSTLLVYCSLFHSFGIFLETKK